MSVFVASTLRVLAAFVGKASEPVPDGLGRLSY